MRGGAIHPARAMETSEFDGAFKKKPPPRAARRRQVGADEDLDSSVRAVAANRS